MKEDPSRVRWCSVGVKGFCQSLCFHIPSCDPENLSSNAAFLGEGTLEKVQAHWYELDRANQFLSRFVCFQHVAGSPGLHCLSRF